MIVMEQRAYLHPDPLSRPDSRTDFDHFEFEFPIAINDCDTIPAIPNDIVFCGKILGRQADAVERSRRNDPFLLRSESIGKINSGRHSGSISYLSSSSAGESRRRRNSGSWKYHNGLFGVLKYPLQMELSDIKMRQGQRAPPPAAEFPVGCDGEQENVGGRRSRWDIVRRLRRKRRETPMSGFANAKGSFACLPIPLPLA